MNLATGRRIGADGLEISRFVPRKIWFDEVSEPSAETIALTAPTPIYMEPDPYHLREPNLPDAVKIWDVNHQRDTYTSRNKEWYVSNGVATQRDHKLEVCEPSCHNGESHRSPPSAHHELTTTARHYHHHHHHHRSPLPPPPPPLTTIDTP